MKKILTFCLLLSIAITTFSQADTVIPNRSIKTDYLKKSKNQKTIAWVLLGSGTTMMVTGLIIARNAPDDPFTPGGKDFNNGVALFVIGGLVNLASILFFIAGARNKRKALSISLKNDLVPKMQQGILVHATTPTLSLVLKL